MKKFLSVIKAISVTVFSAFTTVVMARVIILAGAAVSFVFGVMLIPILGEETQICLPTDWEEGEVGYIDDNTEFIKLNQRYIIKDCLDNSKPDMVQRVESLPNEYYEEYSINGEAFFKGKIEECYFDEITLHRVIIKSGTYKVYDIKSDLINCEEYSTLGELSQRYDVQQYKTINFW